MYLISAREGFWSDNKLAVRDEIKEVDLVGEEPSRAASEPDFLNNIANQKILLLIHGYNNEPEDVHKAYAQIEQKIADLVPGAYDQVIGYIWPGGDDPLDYYTAKTRANALARRVGIWLQKMSERSTAIDVMGHSMGVRVILKALQTQNSKVVRNIFTMAAAVDNESIEVNEKFYSSTSNCESLFVFHSRHDKTLRFAYTPAEFDFALGLLGPEDKHDIIKHSNPDDPATPSVYVVNCKNHIREHGAYKRTGAIYTYIDRYLKGETPAQFETPR